MSNFKKLYCTRVIHIGIGKGRKSYEASETASFDIDLPKVDKLIKRGVLVDESVKKSDEEMPAADEGKSQKEPKKTK